MVKGEKTDQNGKPISKMEAMRRILAEYGQDTKPLDIQAHVKSKFGIEMNTNVISAYKTTLKAGNKPITKAAKIPAAEGAKAAKTPAGKNEGRISVDDIRSIKELSERIGASKVKELVDVLGK